MAIQLPPTGKNVTRYVRICSMRRAGSLVNFRYDSTIDRWNVSAFRCVLTRWLILRFHEISGRDIRRSESNVYGPIFSFCFVVVFFEVVENEFYRRFAEASVLSHFFQHLVSLILITRMHPRSLLPKQTAIRKELFIPLSGFRMQFRYHKICFNSLFVRLETNFSSSMLAQKVCRSM